MWISRKEPETSPGSAQQPFVIRYILRQRHRPHIYYMQWGGRRPMHTTKILLAFQYSSELEAHFSKVWRDFSYMYELVETRIYADHSAEVMIP